MATTTPNYGWPVPTSTDYVKDGATAIEALGDAIDATVFNLGSGPLEARIPTSVAVGSGSGSFNATTGNVTFSGATSISLNGVFNATFSRYVIIGTAGATTGGNLGRMRFRTSGTDNTTSNYNNAIGGVKSSNSLAVVAADQNIDYVQGVMDFQMSNGDFQNYLKIEILNPFQSLVTNGLIDFTVTRNTSPTIERRFGAFEFIPTTSFDGFTIYSVSAMTGTLKVMAYV
jgi:hypothetical protein